MPSPSTRWGSRVSHPLYLWRDLTHPRGCLHHHHRWCLLRRHWCLLLLVRGSRRPEVSGGLKAFCRSCVVVNFLLAFHRRRFNIRRVWKLRHEKYRFVNSLALTLNAGFDALMSQEIFASPFLDIGDGSAKGSPSTVIVGEFGESLLEENGPFHSNVL